MATALSRMSMWAQQLQEYAANRNRSSAAVYDGQDSARTTALQRVWFKTMLSALIRLREICMTAKRPLQRYEGQDVWSNNHLNGAEIGQRNGVSSATSRYCDEHGAVLVLASPDKRSVE